MFNKAILMFSNSFYLLKTTKQSYFYIFLDLEYQRQIEALIERGEESKLSCKSCDKTVSTRNKQNLIAHIESVHLKAEIRCGSCQKTFKATSYLKQHQKRSGCI